MERLTAGRLPSSILTYLVLPRHSGMLCSLRHVVSDHAQPDYAVPGRVPSVHAAPDHDHPVLALPVHVVPGRVAPDRRQVREPVPAHPDAAPEPGEGRQDLAPGQARQTLEPEGALSLPVPAGGQERPQRPGGAPVEVPEPVPVLGLASCRTGSECPHPPAQSPCAFPRWPRLRPQRRPHPVLLVRRLPGLAQVPLPGRPAGGPARRP